MDEAFVTRFWSKVDIRSDEQCWLWTRARHRDGYGQTSFQGKWMAAHRLAYVLTHGEIPEGMHVLHSCDNRACCNPNHMRLGTHHENMRDMVERGRCARKLGVNYRDNPKLTISAVRSIRAAVGVSKVQLAKWFGISPRQVRAVLNREAWRDVE